MPIINFPEWTPDAADLGNPGAIRIINARPGPTGYKPMPSHSVLTGALTDFARGAIDVRDKDLNVFQYAGDETKLYVLASTTWTDKSIGGGYGLSDGEVWSFAKFKNKLLATGWDENPQWITLDGSNFANLTTDFRCRRLAVVRDHVIAANTNDVGDGNVPDRIRSSAFDDETDWTVSPITGSIARDLKGEPIEQVFGGFFGVILTRNSVYRMDWTGAPTWFQINETLPGYGTFSAGASTRIGNRVYALGETGFVAIVNGTGVEEIGASKVNAFVLADIDSQYLHRISSVVDATGRVYWAYPGAGNTAGLANKIAVYDPNLTKRNRWGLIEFEAELLWRAGGVGFTLEQLDSFSGSIDDLEVSLDSSQWKAGGAQLLAGFDNEHKNGFFNGSPMTAILETKEVELHAGRRTHLNAFAPLVDGGTVKARVGYRNRQSDAIQYSSVLQQTATGRFTPRVNARFHRVELTASGNWTDALGVEFDNQDARRGERRG